MDKWKEQNALFEHEEHIDCIKLTVNHDAEKQNVFQIVFSDAGQNEVVLQKGYSLEYDVRMEGNTPGTGLIDLQVERGTFSLSDAVYGYDAEGIQAVSTANLAGYANNKWYSRKIVIPQELIGKKVFRWVISQSAIAPLGSTVTYFDCIRITDANGDAVLEVKPQVEKSDEAVLKQDGVLDYRLELATPTEELANPSGDYLRGTLYTHRSEGILTDVKISAEQYVVRPGDRLEYDITSFDGIMLHSGFGVDLDLKSGIAPDNYGWKDQNGLSAVPGTDISHKASGRWYHREINLTDMASEEIVGWRLVGKINNGIQPNANGWEYNYGFDNIRITNSGETVFTIYENGALKMNEIVRMINCEDTYVAATPYDDLKPIYKVPKFTLKTKDMPVVAYNVKDFGAKGDGETDDTPAFQAALYAAQKIGGGVVFAPAARYAIKGNLYVPRTVQLRGEWQNPLETDGFKGTLLMAYAGRGDEDGIAFITMGRSGSVSHLAVWYPEQKADDIQPYPWTFRNHYCKSNICNVTMYNSYRGIKHGNGMNGNQIADQVYATFLSRGLELDCNFDLPRYSNLYITPEIWATSGLSDAPSGDSLNALKNYLISNLEALRVGRADGLSVYNLNIDYAKIGGLYDMADKIEPETLTSGGAFSNVTNFKLTNVNIGFALEGLAPIGFAGSYGSVDASQGIDPVAVKIASENTRIGFADTVFVGTGHNLVAEGCSEINLMHVRFQSAEGKEAMLLNGGILNMNGCDFTDTSKAMKVSSEFLGGTANGNLNMTGVDQPSGYDKLKIDSTPQEFEPVTENEATHAEYDPPFAGTTTVYNIQKYGAKADGSVDTTVLIQKAVDEAAENGGGIIYFPGGKYRIDGNVTVKSGVELRGALHSHHHSTGAATILEIYGGYGDEDATPTFRLESHAGISGVTFFYPEQLCWKVVEFPWTVQSDGEGCWITNTTFVNAWRGIDFYSHNADKHYIANIGGSFVDGGIFVGNSPTYGTLKNTQMVINYWTGYKDYGCIAESGNVFDTETYKLTASRLVGYQFGDCRNESVLAAFTWVAQIGARFYDQGLGGFNGKFINYGTDAPYINLDIHGAERIVSVSPFMYVHGHSEYSPERSFVKSHETNEGVVAIHNVLGHRNGSCLDNFLIYNGKVTIQQFAADSAKEHNANIQGGTVKLAGITNFPCATVYGGGDPISFKVTSNVQKLTVVGWLDIDREVRITDEAEGKYQGYGIYSVKR